MDHTIGFSAGALLRIILVWWIVHYWATTRYRAAGSSGATAGYETDPMVRAESRFQDRRRSTLLLLTWLGGAIVVWLAGLSVTFESRVHPSSWLVFGIAAVFIAVVFFAAEWAARGGFRMFLNTVGWICVVLITLTYCSAGTHPERLIEQIAQITLNNSRLWLLVIAYFFVLFPAGSMIDRFMDGWADENSDAAGLPGAERWIGRLERFLIVSCMVAAQPAGIVILAAVEGAFRFGQIRNETDPKKQRRLVEYLLVGGMVSYSVALSVGWLVTYLA